MKVIGTVLKKIALVLKKKKIKKAFECSNKTGY